MEHREPSRRSSLKKRKVLIVDDENIVRELIKGVLSEEGIEVLKAVDGYEAIDIFRDEHRGIDLVILDMIMPGIKGDEVLKTLREIRNDIKIIISSGFMSEDQREKLREYRVDGFLDKPYKDKDVIRAITKNPYRVTPPPFVRLQLSGHPEPPCPTRYIHEVRLKRAC